VVRLKITPNAPANAVLGETNGVIRLKIQAPAVDGKANAALVAFLAGALWVPNAAVSLQGGFRNRLKRVGYGTGRCRGAAAVIGNSRPAIRFSALNEGVCVNERPLPARTAIAILASVRCSRVNSKPSS
jgi:uncharacterized protein YggU (UPF0235/DUF167 family)